MSFKSKITKVVLAALIALGLNISNPAFTQAETNTKAASQQLVDALKAMNLDHVDYLYAYLQSIKLTQKEYQQILANAKRAAAIINSVQNPADLSNARKAELLRLLTSTAQLAHLKVSIVDENGVAIDVTNYKLGSSNLLIQIRDLNGNLLATFDPKASDFNVQALLGYLNALVSAIQAKVELDKTDKFVPMPATTLPKTATELPAYLALGGLLVVLGALALIPAVRMARKIEA